MKLSLDPHCKCILELNGKSVELSVAELSALRECFADSGRPLKAALPRELLGRLFANRMLTPSELPDAVDSAYWKTVLSSFTLSPYLNLRLTFAAGNTSMAGTEPAIAMFLQPEFVEAAGRLSNAINDGVGRMTEASAVRGVQFPRDQALRLVHEIAFDWLEARPELARWIEWSRDTNEGFCLSVRDDSTISTPEPSYSLANITFSLNGVASSEPRRVAVPIHELGAVARVLDALRADVPRELNPADLESVSVRRLLGAIENLGGFINRDEAPPLFALRSDEELALSVMHMGHASLIIDGGGRRILIDPWLFAWDDSFEKQPLVSSQLGRVDAILFTHHHQDHMNVDSLLTLPHDVPVFVPCETGAPMEPRSANFLRIFGFQDVRKIAHGDSYSVGDGLSFEAVPFFGESQNRMGFGANCYLISRHGRNALVHADASPDSEGRSLVSTGKLQEIVSRRGTIQVVFGTWWQERRFVYRLSPLAVFSQDTNAKQWLDDTEMCDCPPEFVCELVRFAGADQMVLYAESGKECFLPRQMMSAYVPTVSFLWKPIEAMRELVNLSTGAAVVEAQPHLRVVIPERAEPYIDFSDVGASRKP
jgi:hypothetical protein